MFGFGTSANKSLFGALIDISSGSVGVSIVVTSSSVTAPTILYSNRIYTRITEHDFSKEDELRRIREALFSACLLLSQEGFPILQKYDSKAKITHTFVTCSAPWAYTLAQHVQYENDIRFKISENIITDLVQSAIADISTKFKDSTFATKEGFESVDQITTDIKVNDYEVTDPIGLSGTLVSLSHTVGLVPREIVSGIHEIHDKLFRNSKLSIHTNILAMSTVLQKLFKTVEHSCLIHVSNEATEFGVYAHNLLIENTHISEGINTFVRDIMQTTKKPSTDVESLMQSYTEKSHTSTRELEDQIEKQSEKISETLKAIIERSAVPQEIFLVVQKPHEQLFTDVVAHALKKITPHTKAVIVIDHNICTSFAEGDSGDTVLSFGAQFFHTLHAYSGAE